MCAHIKVFFFFWCSILLSKEQSSGIYEIIVHYELRRELLGLLHIYKSI